jgi:hypothetical protein
MHAVAELLNTVFDDAEFFQMIRILLEFFFVEIVHDATDVENEIADRQSEHLAANFVALLHVQHPEN